MLQEIETELSARRPGWWDRVSALVPELRALEDVAQPPEYHREGDVAVHTRLAVESCPPESDPDLLWAALLHDIGKPVTTRVRDDGRVTAHDHAKVGAEMAGSILARLGAPEARIDRIAWAVRNHLFHLSWSLAEPDQASRRHKRFLRDPRFPLLLELLRADSCATVGNPRGMSAYEFYAELHRQVTGDDA